MKLDKNRILSALLVLYACPIATHAADMVGNPTAIGIPGAFEIEVGGGSSSRLDLDFKQGTGTIQVGSASISKTMPAGSDTFGESQAFVSLGYTFNSYARLIVSIGTANDSGRQSSSRAIGVKLSPDKESSALRTGLVLRVQQVKSSVDGRYVLPESFYSVSDGVNDYYVGNRPLNGSERVAYSRMDAVFGASTKTGLFRTYGGLGFSRISGTYKGTLDDSLMVSINPVAGGFTTNSIERVTFNHSSDITGSSFVYGVLGLSIKPNDELSMTAEVQSGVQRSVMLSAGLQF